MEIDSNPRNLNGINYRVLGNPTDKTPIVFLHGLLGFSANWGKIWPAFQEERQILVFDQRGHGKSQHKGDSYSPEDYCQDLLMLLDSLNWEKIQLVGHSMGGRVAMVFAREYTSRLSKLILEDSGMIGRPDRLNWIRNLLGSIPTPFMDRQMAKEFFENHYRHEPLLGGFLHSNLVPIEGGKMDWRFDSQGMIKTIELGRAMDATEIFSHISVDTLLIRGGKSEEFSQDEAEKMCDSRKNVQLVVIPEAGHFVHAQAPEKFIQIMKNFLG